MSANAPSELFSDLALARFAAAYPREVVTLDHQLLDHPLLTLEAIEQLAAALPEGSVEYNAGEMPIGVDPEDVPPAPLGIAETIRRIAECGSWMVIKRIEQDPRYADLLHAALAGLRDIVGARTGAMQQCEGFIFVSSPGSVTPFHFDPEHNILLQIRGAKTMTLFPAMGDALIDPRIHEAFHLGEHSRNLPWCEEWADRGQAVTLAPGEAVHVPVKTPHWVRNGDAPSISLSITWRSEWSYAEADARALNRKLRQLGLHPKSPAPWPAQNRAKALAYRALRRVRRAPPVS